jgi:hypothetical protein
MGLYFSACILLLRVALIVNLLVPCAPSIGVVSSLTRENFNLRQATLSRIKHLFTLIVPRRLVLTNQLLIFGSKLICVGPKLVSFRLFHPNLHVRI